MIIDFVKDVFDPQSRILYLAFILFILFIDNHELSFLFYRYLDRNNASTAHFFALFVWRIFVISSASIDMPQHVY